ncbi:MAG: tetratricopeptide repeat protein, partial [Candidatus Hydrogenedentes bacterium]|nr:tetratricopeptide repeat protein [Candidatus Hydrogenedentota bacterium]
PVHPKKDVVGYCADCGRLGCAECLKLLKGRLLCSRCYHKEYDKLAEEHKREARRNRRQKQRLVVRYVDGRILKGTSYTLDLNSRGFQLTPVDARRDVEENIPVRFADLKAVFFVRDFDGKFDPNKIEQEWVPEGSEITVFFPDGEVIEGYSLVRFNDESPRFHMIPKDRASNNISLIVERANTTRIEHGHTADKVRAVDADEDSNEPPSQEETLGDFYFETKNYLAALPQYESAIKKHKRSLRLHRKIALTKYNVGVHHIKRKDYPEAMRFFRQVIEEEPDKNSKLNHEARRKLRKLERAVGERSGSTVD